MGPDNGYTAYTDDDRTAMVEAREPMHQRVAALDKRLADVEDFLRRTEQFMGRISRELGI